MKNVLQVVIVIIVVIASGLWLLNSWVSKQLVSMEQAVLELYASHEIVSLEQIKEKSESLALPSQIAAQVETLIEQRLTDLQDEDYLLSYEGRLNLLRSDQIEMFSEILSVVGDWESFGETVRDHILRLRRHTLSGISFHGYDLSIDPEKLTDALYFSADAILNVSESDFETMEMDDASGLFSVMELARFSEEIPLVHLSSQSRQILTYHIQEASPWEAFRRDLIDYYQQSGWSHIPVDPYFPFQTLALDDILQSSDGQALWPTLWRNDHTGALAFVNIATLSGQAGSVVIVVPNQAISQQLYSDIEAFMVESQNTETQGQPWFYNKNAHLLFTENKR